jgi:hypothetical protein
LVDFPVAPIICTGKSATRNLATYPKVVKLLTLGAKTCFNIAQTLSVCELRKRHAQELIPAREVSDSFVSLISFNALSELRQRHEVHQLRKDHFSGVHSTSPSSLSTGKGMIDFPKSVEIDHVQKSQIR